MPFMRILARCFFLWAGLLLLSGCSYVLSDDGGSGAISERSQIIVKFSRNMSEQEVKVALRRMSNEMGYQFSFLRPMSGGAYVITVRRLPAGQMQTLLNRLNARKDIEYAAEDYMMHPLQKQHAPFPNVQ